MTECNEMDKFLFLLQLESCSMLVMLRDIFIQMGLFSSQLSSLMNDFCNFDQILFTQSISATIFLFYFSNFAESRSHGGGGGNNSNLENFNTYGLSVKFLEGLGVTGPLHTKVFVANVSIHPLSSFLLKRT